MKVSSDYRVRRCHRAASGVSLQLEQLAAGLYIGSRESHMFASHSLKPQSSAAGQYALSARRRLLQGRRPAARRREQRPPLTPASAGRRRPAAAASTPRPRHRPRPPRPPERLNRTVKPPVKPSIDPGRKAAVQARHRTRPSRGAARLQPPPPAPGGGSDQVAQVRRRHQHGDLRADRGPVQLQRLYQRRSHVDPAAEGERGHQLRQQGRHPAQRRGHLG